jgi:hypothetical protein
VARRRASRQRIGAGIWPSARTARPDHASHGGASDLPWGRSGLAVVGVWRESHRSRGEQFVQPSANVNCGRRHGRPSHVRRRTSWTHGHGQIHDLGGGTKGQLRRSLPRHSARPKRLSGPSRQSGRGMVLGVGTRALAHTCRSRSGSRLVLDAVRGHRSCTGQASLHRGWHVGTADRSTLRPLTLRSTPLSRGSVRMAVPLSADWFRVAHGLTEAIEVRSASSRRSVPCMLGSH